MAGVQSLIDLTRRMVAAARNGEWDELQSLSAMRETLLAAYSARPEETTELGELKRLDDTVLGLARRRREELGQTIGERQHRAAAVRAYQQTF